MLCLRGWLAAAPPAVVWQATTPEGADVWLVGRTNATSESNVRSPWLVRLLSCRSARYKLIELLREQMNRVLALRIKKYVVSANAHSRRTVNPTRMRS